MSKLKLSLAAIAICTGLGMSGASALPLTDLSGVANATGPTAQVDQVRLVCNRWGRCWRVGGWNRGYRGGWHRGYRRW